MAKTWCFCLFHSFVRLLQVRHVIIPRTLFRILRKGSESCGYASGKWLIHPNPYFYLFDAEYNIWYVGKLRLYILFILLLFFVFLLVQLIYSPWNPTILSFIVGISSTKEPAECFCFQIRVQIQLVVLHRYQCLCLMWILFEIKWNGSIY